MAIDLTSPYSGKNVFARILNGDLPSRRVYEDAHVIAFEDARPAAPTHVLVIPRGAYVGLHDFTLDGTDAELAAFTRALGGVARALGLEAAGYRVIINTGPHGGQEVPHLHAHILAGRPLGPMLAGA